MILKALLTAIWLFILSGCSSHSPNPNAVMMDKLTGELDRETAK